MKKLSVVLLALSLMFCVVVPAVTPAVAATAEYPLYAGQTNYAGKAIVTTEGGYLKISCVNDPLWKLSDIRVAIATKAEDIPHSNGGPIPGKFPYSGNPALVPLSNWPSGTELVIAVHGIAQKIIGYGPPNLTEFALKLPAQANVSIGYPGTNCYFNANISNWLGTSFTAPSYCVDTDHTITTGTQYTVTPYSSYGPMPAGLVSYPENFDLVNWIFNQNYIGKTSACGGNYTSGDIQVALWKLTEATPPGALSTVGSYSQCRADEIVASARLNGEGYTPKCGDYVVVVLVPIDGSQIIIIPMKPECTPIYGGSETAWAAEGSPGTHAYPGKNWATYFHFTIP